MIVPALLALHAALTIFGRLIVQARAGMLPVAWALVESASVVVPMFAAGLCSRPLAVVSVGIAALVAVVGIHVAMHVDETLALAAEGARERKARRLLRRPTPEEYQRIAVPITSGVDLDAARHDARRRADRAMRECADG
jgi:hypothetical protein